MKKVFCAALCAVLLVVSHAPQAVYFNDSRVAYVTSSDQELKLNFLAGHPIVVEFDDPITNIVVSGLSDSDWRKEWEILLVQTRLFMKAISKDASPRTVLVTTTSGSHVLDLVRHAQRSKDLVFLSKMVIKNAKPNVGIRPVEDKIIGEPKPEPIVRAKVVVPYSNRNYTMQLVKNAIDIRPSEVWDDGKFTYMRFPRNQPLPVIYRSTLGSQQEALVNFHVREGVIVLHAISPMWNLRHNGSLIGVFNESYTPDGVVLPQPIQLRRIKK